MAKNTNVIYERELKAMLIAELVNRLEEVGNRNDVKELASSIGIIDHDELKNLVKNMSFEDAFKKLDSFNLENDYVDGAAIMRFDLNYKSIATTIYKCGNGCRVHNVIDVWLNNVSSPILQCYLIGD